MSTTRCLTAIVLAVFMPGASSGQSGFRPRPTYRPNEDARPTVCLIHGMNSTSEAFLHMVPLLEQAGYGVVLYDYPYDRDLDLSVTQFRSDLNAFRSRHGEHRPWALLGHSMGGLVARAHVESEGYAGDVSELILIAPPNHGSALARNQPLVKLIDSLQLALDDRHAATDVLTQTHSEAALDLLPGSAFLKRLNARPRRPGVRYCVLAGDAGFLPVEARRRVELQLGMFGKAGGLLGGLSRLASNELGPQLDELTDGSGDGVVTVASTRLEGVTDHVVIHANHVELVRGPLLYPEPGPVACMPQVLKWLGR